MKFDQASKDLLAGARYIQQYGFPHDDPHPLRAIAITLQNRRGIDVDRYGVWRSDDHRERYHAAADRLHNCCGIDNMDLTPEEAIDFLVAAAYWEVP